MGTIIRVEKWHKLYGLWKQELFLKTMHSNAVKMDCIFLGLLHRKASWCVVRADKSWVEAECLTDSSCMQRWVASAGFTLLAFACLQLAWCSCQPVIDEYHHLKCKRKRLCEGRHDELPPAGALRHTLGAPLSPVLFSFCSCSPYLYFTAPPSVPLSFSPFMLLYFCHLFLNTSV